MMEVEEIVALLHAGEDRDDDDLYEDAVEQYSNDVQDQIEEQEAEPQESDTTARLNYLLKLLALLAVKSHGPFQSIRMTKDEASLLACKCRAAVCLHKSRRRVCVVAELEFNHLIFYVCYAFQYHSQAGKVTRLCPVIIRDVSDARGECLTDSSHG